MRRVMIAALWIVCLLPFGPSDGVVALASCDGVAEYVVELQAATGESIPPILRFDDGLINSSPGELRELAAKLDQWAEKLREIDPPPIATDFHESLIASAQMMANILRDGATIGIFSAFLLYLGDNEGSGPTNDQLQSLLAQRCVEFRPYVVWINTFPNSPALPVASPSS